MIEKNETGARWTIFYDPHSEGKGKKTAELAQKLYGELAEKLGKDLHPQLVRCEPTPYFGRKCSNGSTLSNVDLAIVDKNKKVIVLCEVEEQEATPKQIIGDIVNIFLADRIKIQRKNYNLNKMYFILGVKVKERGKSADKAKNLEKRIQGKLPDLSDKIEVVISDDIDELINNIKKKIVDKMGCASAGFKP